MASKRSNPSTKAVPGRNGPARRDAPTARKHAKKNARKRPVSKKATTGRAAAKKARTVAAKKPAAKKAAAAKAPRKKSAARQAAPKKVLVPRKRKLAAPKKPVAKAIRKAVRPAAAKKTTAVRAPIRRRDGSGHIEARYAKDLLEQSGAREADGAAFIGGSHTNDDLAEELGEEAVETMTSGEDKGEDVADQDVPEERGGPFVVTAAGTEFADGIDASNPRNAKREPFPTT
jgi:hypothetical protein